METDRFGNTIDPEVGYARGEILKSSVEEEKRQARAFDIIKKRVEERGKQGVFNFTGIDRGFTIKLEDMDLLDEFVAIPVYEIRLNELAIGLVGGSPEHNVAVFNRGSGGIIASVLTLVGERETVISVTPPGASHPAVAKGATLVRANLIEVNNSVELKKAIEKEGKISLIVVTGVTARLEVFPQKELEEIVKIAKDKNIFILLDEGIGTGIRTVIENQSKALELGFDVTLTTLEGIGFHGPRFGVMVGKEELIRKISADAYSLGLEARPAFLPGVIRSLEQYRPDHIQQIRDMGRELVKRLTELYGKETVKEMPVGMQIMDEDILAIVMEKAQIEKSVIVPVEASQALAMILLEDYGIITWLSILSSLRYVSPSLKVVLVPEVAKRFGGVEKVVKALDNSFDKLSKIIMDVNEVKKVLLGE
ncbi:MAG: aminotransferase class I/II-fold pyridoxal phosphate-dependent enzyme [Nitrososphaeria archaeon]|nr:aminotransferase class I/II-fold pyridoxal phosphate-dependent enzyme [Nitrososphaeria archaeon]NIQ33319.1 aminotransferase class I/II-fold pyridoxal phosphate-dependent enzyme [Nitrososphaeria archaeon]